MLKSFKSLFFGRKEKADHENAPQVKPPEKCTQAVELTTEKQENASGEPAQPTKPYEKVLTQRMGQDSKAFVPASHEESAQKVESRPINAYLKTHLSPYTLNNDAMGLITLLNEDFSTELEQKILVLLNAATIHPSMSHYQLSLTHKALGDCYFKNGYYGSALEQYNRGLAYNKNLSVKRRLNQISAMSQEERKISLSPDTSDDVLKFSEYRKLIEDDAADRKLMSDVIWAGHEDIKAMYDAATSKLIEATKQEDAVYDPSHEAEIERRLDALGEPYKSCFYKTREKRLMTHTADDPISLKEYDLLDLQSMERSATTG